MARILFPVVIALLALFSASGCYSTTKIYSDPPGARVVMDHQRYLGETPVELKETVWLWTRHSLTIDKKGYTSVTLPIRNEGLNYAYLAVCVCTGGLLLPIMFASKYPPQYTVTLEPTVPATTATPFEKEAAIAFH